MLKNYFKIGLRVLWKNKGYSFIHIAGLSVGLWACMMVATVVIDALSYDKQWSRAADIYRIISVDEKAPGLHERSASSHEGLAAELEKLFPEVESWSALNKAVRHLKINKTDYEGIETSLLRMDTTAWKMLDIKVTSGNPEKFVAGTNNVIVSKSFAARFYPGQDLTGKIIYDMPSYQAEPSSYLVTGVMDDLPYNSHLRADAIWVQQSPRKAYAPTGFYSFAQNYVMLRRGTDINAFTAKANKWYQDINKDNGVKQIELQPIREAYLHSDFAEGQPVKGDARVIYIFSGVAVLLLFIACVNFINLSTARAFARLKEAGVRRVLSGSRVQLIMQLLAETLILFSVSAAIAAVFYAYTLAPVEQFLGHQLVQTFINHLPMSAVAGAIVLLTSLLTGFYPAWLVSGFKPANTLRGMISNSFGQSALRKSLVVVQFSISLAVLLATIVVWKQLNLMENKDLGYNKNNLLSVASVSWDGKADAFKNELLRVPGVKSASICQWLPTEGGGYMTREIPDPRNADRKVKVWYIAGDADLAATMGWKLAKGRMFRGAHSADVLNADSLQRLDFAKYEAASAMQASLMTESAARILGVTRLDRQIPGTRTVPVGVIRDFNNESLYEPIKPTLILAHRSPEYGGMLIRVEPGSEKQVSAAVGKLWKTFFPAKLLEINRVEDQLLKQYESETRMRQLFVFFSALSMFLSALGIFGLVVQAAEHRAKEVGIRKVLGASVAGIVALLSTDFLKLVLIAVILASPPAWLALNKWLENYPFRTELNWWIFALAGAGALIITLFTVSFQALKAALTNPVRSLRNE